MPQYADSVSFVNVLRLSGDTEIYFFFFYVLGPNSHTVWHSGYRAYTITPTFLIPLAQYIIQFHSSQLQCSFSGPLPLHTLPSLPCLKSLLCI